MAGLEKQLVEWVRLRSDTGPRTFNECDVYLQGTGLKQGEAIELVQGMVDKGLLVEDDDGRLSAG